MKTSDRIAVALTYDGEHAPVVSAKGEGDLAEQIIALAKAHDVPLMENVELLKLLALLEMGEEIPNELYITVAEIISFAYWLKGKMPEGYTPRAPGGSLVPR